MGNLGFLIPTVNKEDFNIAKIHDLLQKQFLEFSYEIFPDELAIVSKEGNRISSIYFDNNTGIIEEDCPDELKHLKGEPSFSFTYPTYMGWDEINHWKVFTFLHSHFKAYWLDEGIHPEFMGPNYVFKEYNW